MAIQSFTQEPAVAAPSTSKPSRKPILVIGGGLSGLATARLLTNAGIEVIVFEAASPHRSQGFALSLHDWAYTPLLSALGDIPLSSLIRGVAPDRLAGGKGLVDQVLRDNSTGEVLLAPRKGAGAEGRIVRANRDALRTWIEDCGEMEVDMRYEHRLKSVKGRIGEVVVEFENGATYEGSLVIAADGLHSTVRSRLLPDVVPEHMAAVVYHGVFRISRKEFDEHLEPVLGTSNLLAGVGDGFNTPMTIINIGPSHVDLDWSYSRPRREEGDVLSRRDVKVSRQGLIAEIEERSLAEPWSRYLNAETIKSHRVISWPSRCVSMSKDDLEEAARSGVIFVGDSWHAMPVFGGEGGNHAILDAVELSRALTLNEGRPGRAIEMYYECAWRRCNDAVGRSKQRFHLLHRPLAEWKEIAAAKLSIDSDL